MQAMRVYPELRAYHREKRAQVAQPLADEIAAAAKVPMEEALLVATCAVEAHVAILDFWQIETGGRDERIQGHVQAMMTRYLAAETTETQMTLPGREDGNRITFYLVNAVDAVGNE